MSLRLPDNPVAPVLDRIDAYLDHWAAIQPDSEFLIDGGPSITGRRLTWAQTRVAVDSVAAALMAAGMERGDRVAYLSDSRLDFFVHFLAATSIGLIWQGLNPKYTWSEVSYVVADAGPRIVFDGVPGGSDGLADRLVAEIDGVERCIAVDTAEWIDFEGAGTVIHADALAERRAEVQPMDPGFIVYTSGSTGRPKGALLTHRGVCWCGVTGSTARGAGDEKILCNLPVNHVGSVSDICCRKMVAGGAIVFQERFDPALDLATIAEERIGVWGGVPTMFQLCTAHPDFAEADLSSVRQLAWGGAAMPAPVLERLLAATDVERCTTGYGMSETTGGVFCTPPGADMDMILNTVGVPIPGHEFRIMAADDRMAEPGESGEIQVRGDWIMAGYWNRPEATAEAIDAEGWLHTGDLVVMRPDGCLRIVGRMSEMFKTGGYNAYPREIEICLEDHPAVRIAAVVGVRDPVFDEVGHAFVVAEPGTDPAALRDHCREQLANYKVPKMVHLRDALPMLAVGKIDKKSLKAEATALLEG